MRYPAHLLDEIRARLPVTAVVGRKVALKRAGREWRGLSPFNAEKTPSFYVNDPKGFYHCFSSGKHGDIFSFVMETEGLTFPEAAERLASEAGVELPRSTPEAEKAVEAERGLLDVVDLACRFFEAQLARAAGAGARAYLERRGILPATQAEFRMGWAPDGWTGLLDHLREKGVPDNMTVRAGLAIERDGGRGLYDRFRGRVIFPIQDLKGRAIAFGGRAMADDVQPKYLNSPETELFRKGELVFNAHRARPAARREQALAVVEGYVDAIAAFQAGHKAVVASLGTAFTEEQIKALWRIDPEPVLCFDGDRAGRAAAARALDRMLPHIEVGRTFRFAFLPDGQDPDDAIRAGGIEAFQAPLATASRFWDMLWARESESVDASDPDGIARLAGRLKALVATIGDPQLRYRYELVTKLSVNELTWRATRQRFREPGGAVSRRVLTLVPSAGVPLSDTHRGGIEEIFLGLCIAFPDFAAQALDELSRIRFRGTHRLQSGQETAHHAFAEALFGLIYDDPEIDTGSVYARMNPVFFEVLDDIHGSSQDGRPSGHALVVRFPAFGFVRDPAYFSRCFWNFLDMLVVREMEDEVHDPDHADGLDDAERTLHVMAEIHMRRERIHQEENDLTEIADAYRPKRAA